MESIYKNLPQMKKIKQFNSDKLKYKHLQYAKNMCNRFYTKINTN